MTNTVQILSINQTGKENILQKELKNQSIKVLDSYLFSNKIGDSNFHKISNILSNNVSQVVLTNKNYKKILLYYGNFNWVVEIKFLPGVTDNIANTAKEIILEKIKGNANKFKIGSSKIFLIKGSKKTAERITKKESNPLIHKIRITTFKKYLHYNSLFVFAFILILLYNERFF